MALLAAAESLRARFQPLNLRAVSLAEGLRAALSVAVIIALNQYLQWPPLVVAALAALNTCLCDPGGLIRRRVPVLLLFTMLGGLVMAGAGLARSGGIAIALPVGVAGLFCASFVRIYGETPQLVGVLLGVMLILALDHPVPDLAQAGVLVATFISGGLWATLLTLVIWRIHPYKPAQHAVAEVYRALSAATGNLRSLLDRPVADEAPWDAHANAYLGVARTAIESAREALTDIERARGGASEEVRHGVIRLEASDQLLGALIAFGDQLQRADPAERVAADALLSRLQAILLTFARSIETANADANQEIASSIAAMTTTAEALPERDAERAVARQIIDRLRIAHTFSVPAHFLPGAGLDGTPPDLRQRLLQPLLANLDWRSPALRHAARLAVAAAPALAFTMLWFTPFDHWLTITIVMTMQPYFGLTYTRVFERIGGTLAGGLAAAAIGIACTTQAALAVAMFPLAMAALAARTLSYGLFIAWLTPMVVLLVDITEPGTSEWMVAGIRALFTIIAGAVAVAACFLLWPNFQPQRLLQETRAAIAAQGRYAATVLSHLLNEASVAAVERARREGGIASNSLETSISRTLIERAAGANAVLQAATLIDAALRRCAGRMTAIMLDPAMRSAMPSLAWQAWRDWIAASSTALAEGATGLVSPPVPAIEAISRVGRQFELIAGALEHLRG
jgi:uncharacterized membrane protein YccC